LLREDDKGEVPLYVFRDVPRQLNEYEEMSTFHQTSPESGFTKRWICSKATRDGRITVANRRLIVAGKGRREESVLSTDDELRRCLRDHCLGGSVEARGSRWCVNYPRESLAGGRSTLPSNRDTTAPSSFRMGAGPLIVLAFEAARLPDYIDQ
jgi:hypothetical protein